MSDKPSPKRDNNNFATRWLARAEAIITRQHDQPRCKSCGGGPASRIKLKDGSTVFLCRSCSRERVKAHEKLQQQGYQISRQLVKDLGRICQNCGAEGEVDAHHKTPLYMGGTNDLDNFILLCKPCHKAAHDLLEGKQ